jgi:hypothetical protein
MDMHVQEHAPAVTLETLATEPVWVAWQLQPDGKRPPKKMPYSPCMAGPAKANDPRTWGTREQAEKRFAGLPKPLTLGGIGIEFCASEEGWSIGGIDLDTCRCPESGEFQPWAIDVMDRLASYTEISPSGGGAKVFFLYRTEDIEDLRALMGGSRYGVAFKWPGKDHPPAIEVHLGNRYFAVTGDMLSGSTPEFRRVPTDLLVSLLAIVGPKFVEDGKAAEATREAQEADERAEAKAEAQAEKAARKAEKEAERAEAKAARHEKKAADRSRSAVAFAKGKALRRAGKTYDEMKAALLADSEVGEWAKTKGMAAQEREMKRIWAKAEATGPVIKVEPGELHIAATQAEEALIQSELPIYQRGRFLMKPVTTFVPASDDRMTQVAVLSRLTVPHLVDKLCGVAEFERYDGRADDYVRITPPNQLAQILLERAGEWSFPIVAGIVTCPTLRRDGSLLTKPGYDERTHLYHVADPGIRIYPEVYEPSREYAEKALGMFRNLLQEFPFCDEASRSVGYSILMTPIIRAALSNAPLHLAKAPTPGTGKSFLFDLASYIYSGRPCPIVRASDDPKETEKGLAGALLAGRQMISLDNINGEIGSDLLAQAVSQQIVEIRNFGTLELFEVANTATFFANGNNCYVRDDMVRRTVQAMLDAMLERPELRVFKRDPVATILADRGRYISCALIIVRAYVAAGMPSKPTPLKGFDDWSNLIRGSLMWLGCADPVLTMEAAREDDPTLTALREMMTAWGTTLGTFELTLSEVAQRLKPADDLMYRDLREVVFRRFGQRGELDTQQFGIWLDKQKNKIVDGRRFVKLDKKGHGGGKKWVLQKI